MTVVLDSFNIDIRVWHQDVVQLLAYVKMTDIFFAHSTGGCADFIRNQSMCRCVREHYDLDICSTLLFLGETKVEFELWKTKQAITIPLWHPVQTISNIVCVCVRECAFTEAECVSSLIPNTAKHYNQSK